MINKSERAYLPFLAKGQQSSDQEASDICLSFIDQQSVVGHSFWVEVDCKNGRADKLLPAPQLTIIALK
jgi:hypothetical protein